VAETGGRATHVSSQRRLVRWGLAGIAGLSLLGGVVWAVFAASGHGSTSRSSQHPVSKGTAQSVPRPSHDLTQRAGGSGFCLAASSGDAVKIPVSGPTPWRVARAAITQGEAPGGRSLHGWWSQGSRRVVRVIGASSGGSLASAGVTFVRFGPQLPSRGTPAEPTVQVLKEADRWHLVSAGYGVCNPIKGFRRVHVH